MLRLRLAIVGVVLRSRSGHASASVPTLHCLLANHVELLLLLLPFTVTGLLRHHLLLQDLLVHHLRLTLIIQLGHWSETELRLRIELAHLAQLRELHLLLLLLASTARKLLHGSLLLCLSLRLRRLILLRWICGGAIARVVLRLVVTHVILNYPSSRCCATHKTISIVVVGHRRGFGWEQAEDVLRAGRLLVGRTTLVLLLLLLL